MKRELVQDPSHIGSYHLAITAITFICLSWPFLFLRLYVRSFLVRSFGKDDVAAVLGQICYTAFCTGAILSNQLSPPERSGHLAAATRVLNVSIATGILYCLSTLLIKLSLGFSFLRVLPVRAQQQAAWGLIIISTVANLALAFYLLFSCGNPSQFASKVLHGTCKINNIQFRVMMYLQSCINILVDIGLLALPLSTIMKSMMTTKAKISVTLIFVLACSGTICSIVRLYFLTTLFNNNLGDGELGEILSITECGVFIIAGCLATMRVLLSVSVSRRPTSNGMDLTEWPSNSEKGETGASTTLVSAAQVTVDDDDPLPCEQEPLK